jgi:hypothetical protein
MKFFSILIAGAGLAAALCFFPMDEAKAQYVCGSGPGPGERMVGQTMGADGTLSVPLCVQEDGPVVSPPGPSSAIWGAVAQTSGGASYFSWGFWDENSATAQATGGCAAEAAKQGGGSCKLVTVLSGQFAAVARGSDGRDHVGVWVSIAEAKKRALKACNKTKVPGCQITYLMNAVYGPLDINSKDLI